MGCTSSWTKFHPWQKSWSSGRSMISLTMFSYTSLGCPTSSDLSGTLHFTTYWQLDDADDGEIVDIKVEPVVTSTTTVAPETTVPTYRKKRSNPLEQVMRSRRDAMNHHE